MWTPRQSRMLGTSDGAPATAAIIGLGKKTRVGQPQGAVRIDRSNVFGARVIDGFVGPSPKTFTGNTITKYGTPVASPYVTGLGVRGSGDAGLSFLSNLTAHNGITIVFQYVQHSRSGTQVLFEHSVSQNTNGGTFILYTDATAGKLAYGTSGGGSYDARTTPLPELGTVVTVALRLRFTASANSSVDVGLWLNGVAPASLEVVSIIAARNFGDYATYCLGRAGTTLRADATIGMYAVLAGFASDAECAELSRSPYQIFAPDTTPIWGSV